MFNLPQLEEIVLDKWRKEKTFQKSLSKPAPQGEFVFYDGPPFATGLPHYGHLVQSLIKDVIPRYKTMQGWRVPRRWGWDTHGLPIENLIEKELGLQSKKDILEFGVDKFNQACFAKVMLYREEWRRIIERFGRWVDMDNDYKTMDKEFMESVWWVFKQLWDRGLIYQAYKALHVCPRCETTLSQSEVAEGYKLVKDWAIIVRLPLLEQPHTNLLIWTTTPWTLPGNVAVAVHPQATYAQVQIYASESDSTLVEKVIFINHPSSWKLIFGLDVDPSQLKVGQTWTWVPSDNKKPVLIRIEKVFLGEELVGKFYQPIFPYYQTAVTPELTTKVWRVYPAEFVNETEGTGLVHIAPAFGHEDMILAQKFALPFWQHVTISGEFKPEVSDFSGEKVKPKDQHQVTDRRIAAWLKQRGRLWSEEEYEHSYPHCWRCDTPLLNYATTSWFVRVTNIKEQLLQLAEQIEWVPEHIKTGRFGKWLEGARDWCISRQRFWGSVIPLWQCDNPDCSSQQVFDSIAELEKISGKKVTDLHKHKVDKITFPCTKCGGTMRRIPDVLDCWFESGSMPYGQFHYPFTNKDYFKVNFPADFIAEAVDQTRTWFYYLHVLSVALFNKPAFKHVIVSGIVLAADGKKMSKRLKNYPEAEDLFHRYGADAVRYYLVTSPVVKGEELRFEEEGVAQKATLFQTLLNVVKFYQMVQKTLSADISADFSNSNQNHILDIWLQARFNQLLDQTTYYLEKYYLQPAARLLEDFIQDLSTWYLRRSRDRLKSSTDPTHQIALETLKQVLVGLTKLMAPFTPFLAEYIYSFMLKEGESVHLSNWPEHLNLIQTLDQEKVLKQMVITRKLVELGLAARQEAGIGIRQPLAGCLVKNFSSKLEPDYQELIKEELNVKTITFQDGEGDVEIDLDTRITPELKREGLQRELIRRLNNLRKEMGLILSDQVDIYWQTDDPELSNVIAQYSSAISQATIARSLKEQSHLSDGTVIKFHQYQLQVKLVKVD